MNEILGPETAEPPGPSEQEGGAKRSGSVLDLLANAAAQTG